MGGCTANLDSSIISIAEDVISRAFIQNRQAGTGLTDGFDTICNSLTRHRCGVLFQLKGCIFTATHLWGQNHGDILVGNLVQTLDMESAIGCNVGLNVNGKIHSKQNESLKPSLAYGKLCEPALEGGVETQHDIMFRHASFYQFESNAAFGAVMLNPDFAVFDVEV